MGVVKAWRFSWTPAAAKLALLQQHHQNGFNNGGEKKHVLSLRSPAPAPAIAIATKMTPSLSQKERKQTVMSWSWSLVCGLMLFGLGLISLFTGHVASDLEWYSHRLVMNTSLSSFYTKRNGNGREAIDVWKSSYSKFYYGCSQRGPRYAPAVKDRSSNGYLLIATSGGLNQQRTGITDAVVVTRILNATLVVPVLQLHRFSKKVKDAPTSVTTLPLKGQSVEEDTMPSANLSETSSLLDRDISPLPWLNTDRKRETAHHALYTSTP